MPHTPNTDLKIAAPVAALPLVKDPLAIRVKTISPKIVDQLLFLDGSAGSGTRTIDFKDLEIIGTLAETSTVVVIQKSTGHLARVRHMAYAEHIHDSQAVSWDDAHAQLRALPQLFQA